MKKIALNLSLVLAAAFMLASCNNNKTETAEETAVDSTAIETTYALSNDASSFVEWKGEMLGMYSHNGTVAVKEGSITTKGGAITAGNFTVDMTTITPKDSNYDKDRTTAKLVGHLSSPDFFDIATYPTATFVISSVNGNEATGTLTVRGKSNEETIKNIVLTEEGETLNATGTLTFDRQKYGVAFKMTAKDMVLGDNIELKMNITAKK